MFKILIVEDDKELSQLFQKVLEKSGYQVKSAIKWVCMCPRYNDAGYGWI